MASKRRSAYRVPARIARQHHERAARPEAHGIGCLVLGKNHPRYNFGPYSVCPTENQAAVLFEGKMPRKLGCGVFACAYEHPSDPQKVVKLTRDSEDVSALIEAQDIKWPDGTARVPKLYTVYELKQGGASRSRRHPGKRTRVYAMIVERLYDVPREQDRWRGKAMDYISRGMRHKASWEEIKAESTKSCPRSRRVKAAYEKTLPAQQEYLPGMAPPEAPAASAPVLRTASGSRRSAPLDTCYEFVDKLVEAQKLLKERGIDWIDMHTGNIGFDADGRWKILDLGLTRHTRYVDTPSVLEGMLARAAMKVERQIRWRRRAR